MKVLAMYLPQYHEIPENDEWWGIGFTEWTNVKKSKPIYEGHIQPRRPLDYNYYDLSNPNEMKRQMEMAKKYGVDGFCFYHYWFRGKKLLEKPVEAVLDMDDPLPFCLCWANHSWSRNWDGIDSKKGILIRQEYGDRGSWIQHYNYLRKFFLHDKYIKHNNRPVIVIYNPNDICNRTVMYNCWEEMAVKDGFDGIYTISASNHEALNEMPYKEQAIFDFEPFSTNCRLGIEERKNMQNIYAGNCNNDSKRYKVIDYELFCKRLVSRYMSKSSKHYPGFFVGWDNSPRRGINSTFIFENNTPVVFGKYFAMQYERALNNDKDYLFINAWNEWGEGTFLEPDELYKYGYLEEIYNTKKRYKDG